MSGHRRSRAAWPGASELPMSPADGAHTGSRRSRPERGGARPSLTPIGPRGPKRARLGCRQILAETYWLVHVVSAVQRPLAIAPLRTNRIRARRRSGCLRILLDDSLPARRRHYSSIARIAGKGGERASVSIPMTGARLHKADARRRMPHRRRSVGGLRHIPGTAEHPDQVVVRLGEHFESARSKAPERHLET